MKRSCVFLVAAFLFAIPVHTDAMWCGMRLVSVGDTKAEVLAKCGEPFFSDIVAVETVEGRRDTSFELPVEQWVYNQGPDTFLKILTFKGGRLVKVEDGDRVERE